MDVQTHLDTVKSREAIIEYWNSKTNNIKNENKVCQIYCFYHIININKKLKN